MTSAYLEHLMYDLRRSDAEIVGYALETLCSVMSNELPEDGLSTVLLFFREIQIFLF